MFCTWWCDDISSIWVEWRCKENILSFFWIEEQIDMTQTINENKSWSIFNILQYSYWLSLSVHLSNALIHIYYVCTRQRNFVYILDYQTGIGILHALNRHLSFWSTSSLYIIIIYIILKIDPTYSSKESKLNWHA